MVVLDEGSLFLSSVSLADSGEYECQATNEVGSASRRAKLVVYGKLRPWRWRPGIDRPVSISHMETQNDARDPVPKIFLQSKL